MTELRADARRNREELLDVARQVIREQGVDASLRDIARRAGVGIATLYRHFPTRDDLIAAIIGEGIQRLNARAAELAETKPPGEALEEWLSYIIERGDPIERGRRRKDTLSLGLRRTGEDECAKRNAGPRLK